MVCYVKAVELAGNRASIPCDGGGGCYQAAMRDVITLFSRSSAAADRRYGGGKPAVTVGGPERGLAPTGGRRGETVERSTAAVRRGVSGSAQ